MPLNVFSFGCVVCHLITQKWPMVKLKKYLKSDATQQDDRKWFMSQPIDEWHVEKHQNYIDQINDDSLKQLIEACLQKKPSNRPNMLLIYNRITSIMEG